MPVNELSWPPRNYTTMKKSNINFVVGLDAQNIPDKITWEATDQTTDGPSDTRAISLSIWDHHEKNTLRIDLWTKEMTVEEMKQFCITAIGGLAQTVLNATGDTVMAEEMDQLCNRLVKHVEKEHGE